MKIFDKIKNRGEVWHYICENEHEWKSRQSPCGNAIMGFNLLGEKCTHCPICGTEICMGEVYIDGIKTKMGAIHKEFKK